MQKQSHNALASALHVILNAFLQVFGYPYRVIKKRKQIKKYKRDQEALRKRTMEDQTNRTAYHNNQQLSHKSPWWESSSPVPRIYGK